jgi:alpha-D-xyloside xylohydrolase
MMRAMALEFDDPACATLDLQYMLGDSLLVAPIFNEEGVARYYVPKGEWVNFLSGKTVEGGRWVKETFDYFGLPLLVRSNSVIAIGSRNDRPDYDYADNVVFHVFGLENGKKTAATLCGPDSMPEIAVIVSREGGRYQIETANAQKPWKVCLRGINTIHSVQGGFYAHSLEGAVIVPDEGAKTVTVIAE